MTEKCSSCDQMKKENTLNRKALMDTNKNYVEVVNEGLAKQREIDRLKIIVGDLNGLVDVNKREIEGLNKLVDSLSRALQGGGHEDNWIVN